jgi:glycosyltransferase involved in cell wall biosynthesis
VGLIAHRDIPKYYAAADVYISPSFYESFGMSIIEAMAAGIPVVAASVGAVPELISNNETGLLVQPNSAPEIADAVCRLFANSELKRTISSSARELVRQQFSWDQICSTLLAMYQDLSENKAGSTGPALCAPSEAC